MNLRHPTGYRAGRTISIEHWARVCADYEYAVIGDWSDGDGAAVRTVWTGVDADDIAAQLL